MWPSEISYWSAIEIIDDILKNTMCNLWIYNYLIELDLSLKN
jgi:hypothetical protein